MAEAKEMILKTATFGLKTIQKILTIDKGEIEALNLEEVDIADLLKFADLQSFSKMFKKQFRMCPKEYGVRSERHRGKA